jgi:hypothetical protein
VPTPAPTAAAAAPARLVNCGISERFSIPARVSDFWKYVGDTAPISGFKVLKNDVLPVRTARDPDELAARLDGTVRGKIEALSFESRKRLALLAGNCSVEFRSFVTLTYPAEFPCDGLIVKRNLHAILAALRRKCPGLEYLWFLEFQRRGAPHFHAFLSTEIPAPLSPLNRRSGRVRKTVMIHRPWQAWISRRWYDIVGSGDPKHLAAGAAWEQVEKADGAARYVAKECYKTFQKVVPADFQNVGRFWGCSRGVSLVEERDVKCCEADLRQIFPPECFREDGSPHSVLFSAADSYRKIMDTPADPVKIKAWRNGSKEKLLPKLASISPAGVGALGKRSAKKQSRLAQSEWHGSTMKRPGP